jgi:hypothetical protein
MAAIGAAGVSGAAPASRTATGEASPVSLKDSEASIMAGSIVDGAAFMVFSAGVETGPGKVEASEMQAASRPAESNSTTRVMVLLRGSVMLFMSPDKLFCKLKFAA